MKKTKYIPQAGDVCEFNGIDVMVCYTFMDYEMEYPLQCRIMTPYGIYGRTNAYNLKLIYRP